MAIRESFPHEGAIDEYRRAIAFNPSADEAHHQLGLVYLHVGLLDEAARELQEALRLNPANTLAQFRVGVVHLYQGQYQAALDVFKRTPSGFQPPLTAFQTADALFHLGRVEEAAAMSQEYLAAHPADLGGLNTAMLAMVAAKAGATDRVAALVDTAREKGKGYGHFHHTAFTIARAYALIGRTANAISWLQQSADAAIRATLFVNDTALDRIRGEQAFRHFWPHSLHDGRRSRNRDDLSSHRIEHCRREGFEILASALREKGESARLPTGVSSSGSRVLSQQQTQSALSGGLQLDPFRSGHAFAQGYGVQASPTTSRSAHI